MRLGIISVTTDSNDISTLAHPDCVVCGFGNANGLHVEFTVDENSCVSAVFACDKVYQGYPGIVHGGVVCSILDGAMGRCMFARGLTAVTVEMTTKFRHPVVIGRQASVFARIRLDQHPLYMLEAEIVQEGKVKATAEGKYYDQPKLKNYSISK